jgi:RNA 3'-terminal phosphate cyclase (ATP)
MDFLEIDGSHGEGGGQIIRTAVALSSVFGRPIRVTRIRAKRDQPGLRPQHLQSVLVSAKLCGAELSGATVGSTEITYAPTKLEKIFKQKIDTGTAGSVSLIAQTIIPISLFGSVTLDVSLVGGTEVPHSPTVDYIRKIVLPIYRLLGAKVELSVEQRGYYPRGGGIVRLRCERESTTKPLRMVERARGGRITASILSCSRLLPEHVSQRQADSARAILARKGVEVIAAEIDNAGRAFSPGSSVLLYDASDSVFVGSSALGQRGKASESVGEEAALNFLKEDEATPNVDSHMADMLVTLLCCVRQKSNFTTSAITRHFTTNVEVAEKITGCKVSYHEEGLRWHVDIS